MPIRRRFLIPAALLAAVLPACTGEKPSLPAFDVVAYGDCRHKADVHRRIVANMAATKPKLVLVTGDLVDRPAEEPLWATFRDIVKELRAQSVYLSAPGDH